jgi:hypothetical protein
MLWQQTHRQDACAILAILIGLLTATTCWADDPWPQGNVVNVGDNKGPCNQATGYCVIESCIHKGDAGYDDSYFTCGGTIWGSALRIQVRYSGTCLQTKSYPAGSCRTYDWFYCARTQVFGGNFCDTGTEKCKIWYKVSNQCDPNNP